MKAPNTTADPPASLINDEMKPATIQSKPLDGEVKGASKSEKSKYITFAGLLKLPKTLPNGIKCRVLSTLEDEFKIRSQIGQGTFATVWSVVRLKDKSPLAAKIVSS